MEEYSLEALNITKDFPGVRALNNVSLQVKKGEILGLIGENGAGKSTILKIVNGIYHHGMFEGSINIDGKEVQLNSPYDALNKGIGFVSQEINVMDDLSVAENIFVGHLRDKRSLQIKMSDILHRANEFLSIININLPAELKVRMLPIGQKQLLMIARALSWNPKILILDEPTTALAKNDVENLFEIIRSLKLKQTSIVFVTHKLDEVMSLTDRVSILRDGNNIATYTREEYSESQIVTDMVGRTISKMYPTRSVEIGNEVLRINNVTVDHPKIKQRYLIENVSLNLRKGEVLGLAGLVGAGRTETLSAIFGQLPLKSGEIYLEGKQVHIKSAKTAIRNKLCFITEDRKNNGLLMLANIKDNIVISNLKNIKTGILINRKLENTIAGRFMNKLNIKAQNHKTMVVNLSGGNQQKVVIAKALNTEPKVLLMDEPTKGIDVGSKNEIYRLINELAGIGISIIMVSSELPELLAMCDRFIVMAHGKVVGEINKNEASQENVMAKCFV